MIKSQHILGCFILSIAAFLSGCGDSSASAANEDEVLSSSSEAVSTAASSNMDRSSTNDRSSAMDVSSSTHEISQSSSITTTKLSSSVRSSSAQNLISSSGVIPSSSAATSSAVTHISADRNCSYAPVIPATSPATGTLTCPNSEVYATVTIGTAVWMAQNLNYGTRVDGTLEMDRQADDGMFEKYCLGDDESLCDTDGGLYQWAEAMGFSSSCNSVELTDAGCMVKFADSNHQGICPSGWHIPSTNDWDSLITDLGGNSDSVGATMKSYEARNSEWNAVAFNDGNSSGFSALPVGSRIHNGGFNPYWNEASYWTTIEMNAKMAYYRYLAPEGAGLYLNYLHKLYGRSVRCVKNP